MPRLSHTSKPQQLNHPEVDVSLLSSVQFSDSVMSDSLQPHVLQHTRPLCPSPNPGVYSNSCPSSQWCHPTISSTVVTFSHLQPLPVSGSFPVTQFVASDGQNIGVSASTSVLPMNTQDWSPLGWTGCITCSPRDSLESSLTPQFRSINSLVLSLLCDAAHIHTWLLGKP